LNGRNSWLGIGKILTPILLSLFDIAICGKIQEYFPGMKYK
jgi:hypothetical protein